jgi:hypothetical protein
LFSAVGGIAEGQVEEANKRSGRSGWKKQIQKTSGDEQGKVT